MQCIITGKQSNLNNYNEDAINSQTIRAKDNTQLCRGVSIRHQSTDESFKSELPFSLRPNPPYCNYREKIAIDYA